MTGLAADLMSHHFSRVVPQHLKGGCGVLFLRHSHYRDGSMSAKFWCVCGLSVVAIDQKVKSSKEESCTS